MNGENQAQAKPNTGSKDPMGGQGGANSGSAKNSEGSGRGGRDPKGSNEPPGQMYKDVWGHLPEKMRQEMDSYFKEHFMPSYNELLKQYYSKLAEQNKKK